MAENTLFDPFLNPVKFHALQPDQLPNYVSRFMDDWPFRRTIQPWDEHVCFFQPWQKGDTVKLQYTSNFNPIVVRLRNEQGGLVQSFTFDIKQQDELRPEFYIRQREISLAAYDPGLYYFERVAAGQTFVSEPFELLENADQTEAELEDYDPTLYIEYSHYETYGGVKFQAPFSPAIRVPAILKYKTPGSKDTLYEDQLLNQTMINSVPYRIWEFILGGRKGVPPWLIDKVNRIFGCRDVKIDGRLFTKHTSATFEPVEADLYPMSGWRIELREKLNRDSVITENDVVIVGVAAAALIIDNKGFGMSDQAGYSEIISLQ